MTDRLISCDDHMDLSQLPADLWTTRLPAALLDTAAAFQKLVNSESRLDDSASRLFCAGLAVQKILGHLDDIGGFSQTDKERVGYQLHRASGAVTEFRWAEHDSCSCRYAN